MKIRFMYSSMFTRPKESYLSPHMQHFSKNKKKLIIFFQYFGMFRVDSSVDELKDIEEVRKKMLCVKFSETDITTIIC